MDFLIDDVFYALLGHNYSVKRCSNEFAVCKQWLLRVEDNVLLVLDEHDIAALKFLRDHRVTDQESMNRYDKFFSQLTEE